MADRQNHSTAQAWANFTQSGQIADYLRYRALENRADQAAGISNYEPGGSNASANIARRANQRERPTDHGAF